MENELNRAKIGLNAFLNKVVVVKYLDDERGWVATTTGTLTNFAEEDVVDEDGEVESRGFIEISSETDFDRIPIQDVKKVFLK